MRLVIFMNEWMSWNHYGSQTLISLRWVGLIHILWFDLVFGLVVGWVVSCGGGWIDLHYLIWFGCILLDSFHRFSFETTMERWTYYGIFQCGWVWASHTNGTAERAGTCLRERGDSYCCLLALWYKWGKEDHQLAYCLRIVGVVVQGLWICDMLIFPDLVYGMGVCNIWIWGRFICDVERDLIRIIYRKRKVWNGCFIIGQQWWKGLSIGMKSVTEK